MMSKNWKFSPHTAKITICAGLVGLIASGCASFATSNPQQVNNSPNIETSRKNVRVEQDKKTPNIDSRNQDLQVSTKNSPKSDDKKQKLPFVGTRYFNFLGGNGTGQSITIQADGTTIVKLHGKFESLVLYSGKFSNPIIFEQGDGLLLKDDKIYSLSGSGQIAQGCKGEGTLCESSLLEPSSPIETSPAPIAEGLYWLGHTGQGLEVKGEQYRYYDEGGSKEWQPISDLNSVKNGVVYDGENYWCLSSLLPEGKVGACSANGWVIQ